MIYEYDDFGFIGFDVMAEDFVCMVGRVVLPNEFKEGNSDFGNSLALAHGALQDRRGPPRCMSESVELPNEFNTGNEGARIR